MHRHMQASEATGQEVTENQIIVATEVDKSYRTGAGRVHALRSVSLTVQRGEMIAIMGPSGCGKTTLLNCLSGLDDFDGGEVLIEGQSLRRMRDRKRTDYRARRMGFIFQSYNLLPVLTAAENVELPLLVIGTNARQARERALAVLDSVGLGDRSSHRPAELSGGQRQRVTVARALANDPAIIWADEPTGNLDSKTAADILNMMQALNREHNQTFVIVTHDPEVGQQCDRIIHMSDGEIVSSEVVGESAVGESVVGESIYSRGTTSVPLNEVEVQQPVTVIPDEVASGVSVPRPYLVRDESIQVISSTRLDNEGEKEKDKDKEYAYDVPDMDTTGSWLTGGR